MQLHPITKDIDRTKPLYDNDECRELIYAYNEYYDKIGFNPPWIGYFVVLKNEVVGSCGFKGKPKEGKVEVAYWTFPPYQGQGIASDVCEKLITIAMFAQPAIVITAKTLPEHSPSTRVLMKSGFVLVGVVNDDEDGSAWEWVHKHR